MEMPIWLFAGQVPVPEEHDGQVIPGFLSSISNLVSLVFDLFTVDVIF